MGGRGEPELRPLHGCGAELRLPAGRLVDALHPTEAAAVRAALRRYPALLIRRQQARLARRGLPRTRHPALSTPWLWNKPTRLDTWDTAQHTYPPAQALGVGGLDAFTRAVLRGPVYDPSEHGALLPDPVRPLRARVAAVTYQPVQIFIPAHGNLLLPVC
jgi:hypothetical protein